MALESKSRKFFLNELALFLSASAFGISLVVLSIVLSTASGTPSGQPQLVPPRSLKYFSLGYREILGDALWLRTIQDFDYCENRKANESNTAAICKQGWVFKMIDSVTEMVPQFRQPYLSGALMLSVAVNDASGASKIFDKAVKAFPNDGQLLYYAAYQALVEEHDDKKATMLLVQAGKHGAPPWVFALAARLQQKSGQLELARSILTEAAALNPNGPGAERIQQRLDEVEKELAKQPKSP